MTHMAGAGAGIAPYAAVAAIANAIKASGVLVGLEPEEFERLVARIEEPLVVVAETGFFRRRIRYLVGYRGLAFHCKSRLPVQLPKGTELVTAKSISIPSM
jgi:hypothetical protein